MSDRRDDESWRDLRGTWDRLAWARMNYGFETSAAAAESFGMNVNTYRAFEREPESSKHTKLDFQLAVRFARKYKVRWEWLLSGEGDPWTEASRPKDQPAPIADQVVVLLKDVRRERQQVALDMIKAFVAGEKSDKS